MPGDRDPRRCEPQSWAARLAGCWFVGLGIGEPAWDHSTFSKNRDRLLEGAIASRLNAILAQPRINRLLSTEYFSVDGTLI
jgi:transposase